MKIETIVLKSSVSITLFKYEPSCLCITECLEVTQILMYTHTSVMSSLEYYILHN